MTAATSPTVAVLSGGVGAARMLRAVRSVLPDQQITAVVNTGDDTSLHGLHISPDLDTIVYTLADAIDRTRGWGLAGETWHALGALERYRSVRPEGSAAATTWFGLGDRDLATHLYRTARLAEGASLTEVSSEIATAWGLDLAVLPMSDDRVHTLLTRADTGERLSFQSYFVEHRHAIEVSEVHIDRSGAELTPTARAAIVDADVVIIAPSNPLVSIGPIRALPGVDELLSARRSSVVAVSPIVGGAALKGPADRLMRELGLEPSAVGIARCYADVAAHLVIDNADRTDGDAVADAGMNPVVTDSIMSTPEVSAALARRCLEVAYR